MQSSGFIDYAIRKRNYLVSNTQTFISASKKLESMVSISAISVEKYISLSIDQSVGNTQTDDNFKVCDYSSVFQVEIK